MKALKFIFVLLPLFTFGQITINETKSPTFVKIGYYKYSDFNKGDLSYGILNNDTSIVLSCLNQKYQALQEYKTLSFKGGVKEKDALYDALMSFYSEENLKKDDYELNIQLGTYSVKVYRMGKLVHLYYDNPLKVEYIFNKGNIISLFGKKK